MRLIDADEIPYVEDKAWESNNWRGTYKHAFEKDINKMPTIEAIPMSFIVDYLKGLCKRAEEEDVYIITELAGYGTNYPRIELNAIEKLLREWYLEQEGKEE